MTWACPRNTGSSGQTEQAELRESPGANTITLKRINVSPQVLNVANPLIGEWSADWSWPGEDHDGGTWSLKYRNDGTLKLYHHQVHQFENAYALRGNTLVILGAQRFSFAPVIAAMNQLGNGKWNVQEIQTSPNQGPATWTYTKVNAAKWK